MMTIVNEPCVRLNNPNFSSVPCAKRLEWMVDVLVYTALGRSNRAKVGETKLATAIELTREVNEAPSHYFIVSSQLQAQELSIWLYGLCLVKAALICFLG